MNKTRFFVKISLLLLLSLSSLCLLVWFMGRNTVENSDSRVQTTLRFREIQSPEIEFLQSDINAGVPGRYPAFVRFFLQTIFGWKPEGRGQHFSAECSYEQVQKIFRLDSSSYEQSRNFQFLLKKCEAEWNTGTNWHWYNAVRGLAMNYELSGRTHLQNVLFHLPGNIKLRGLLALKDRKARPIVIVRNGIFSSVAEFWPERSFLIHLFEQSPFHLLIVENMTSPDYIANNSHLSLGGFDEGLQNIWLAKTFKDSRQGISKLISEVHFAGISLGGNGLLFASLINQANSVEARPLISSFTALCPVVDLKQAARHLSHHGLEGALVDYWSSKRLAGLKKIDANLTSRSFLGVANLKSEFLPMAIEKISKAYRFNELVTVARIPTSLALDDLWSASDFISAFPELNANLLILGTEYDPAVPWLEQSGRFAKLNRVLFQQGVHCTLDVPYDWKLIGTLLQSRILSQSKSGQFVFESIDFELGPEFQQALLGRVEIKELKFVNDSKSFSFVLKFQEQNRTKWVDFAHTQNISLSSDIYDGDLSWPLSEADQLMVRRWFNQNLSLKVDRKTGKNVLHFQYPHWQNHQR